MFLQFLPVLHALHALYYRFFFLRENWLARSIATLVGKPGLHSHTSWNDEYENGDWNRLHSMGDAAHNAVLLSYLDHLGRTDLSILDIGCGDGVLVPQLKRIDYGRYLGIDISDVAIAKCAAYADEKTSFLGTDAEHYVSAFCPDVMLFDEVIYYFEQPIETAMRYSRHLAPNGVMLISVLDNPRSRAIVRLLKSRFAVLDETVIRKSNVRWYCLALAPS